MEDVLQYLGTSRFITESHIERLRAVAEKQGLDPDQICRETDRSTTMEGLYLKIEEDGCVKERVKFVRASFLQTVEESGTHWLDRPIIPNGLNRDLSELLIP